MNNLERAGIRGRRQTLLDRVRLAAGARAATGRVGDDVDTVAMASVRMAAERLAERLALVLERKGKRR